jgi:hypothetical protein
VRTLAKHQEAAQHPHRRHADVRPDLPAGPQAETPGTGPAEAAPATEPIQQEVQGPEDEQAGPYTEAAQPSASPATPPPASERTQEPAAAPPSSGSGLLSVPLLRMSGSGGHHHDDPAPHPGTQPGAHAGSHAETRSRPHRPRTTVRRQNDEQRFDRDFGDGGGYADDDDGSAGNDGLDLRSLLGDAP